MGKFNEYSQKAIPADNDTLMIYDEASKAKQAFAVQWNLELDCWKTDQCGHQ